MLYSIKNIEDLQKLNKSVSLESQVGAVRLQDMLGEQHYHRNVEKFQKSPTDTIKDTCKN